MKFKELISMSDVDLNAKVKELGLELVKVRGQIAQGSGIKNTSQKRQIKRTIAKIKTLLNMRASGNAPGAKVTKKKTTKKATKKVAKKTTKKATKTKKAE